MAIPLAKEPSEERRPCYLRLSCALQNYAWGKVGQESEVAQLMLGDANFSLDNDLPYAEVRETTSRMYPN